MNLVSMAGKAICGLIFCSALEAQDDRPFITTREPRIRATAGVNTSIPRIRVNSDLVVVPVMVTDPADRLITGLGKSNFRVYEDEVEQQISQFSSEDAPVSVALLFDCSGSMGPKIRKARMAVSEFLKASNPEDEFSLIQFNDRARVAAPFTVDLQEIQNRLTFVESKGRTALLDAIALALDQMKGARHARKALLIISDGGDNCSRFSDREIKKRVREADAQIYSVGIMEPRGRRFRSPEEAYGPALLDDIAAASGGRLYEVDDVDELRDIAVKIGSALRNLYVLGYAPSIPKQDGKYHRITVKVQQPVGLPKLRATFRPSYLAPSN